MDGVRFVTNGNEGELIMERALTIDNAAEIRTAISEALAGTDRLILTIGENAAVDVTFLQILCSAHRTAMKADKRLGISTYRESIFFSVVMDAGFDGHEGCSLKLSGGCLWLRGGSNE